MQVNRRALAFGTIARHLLAAANAMRREMRGDGGGVERRNPQAQMIEIGAAGARRSLRRPGLVGRNDIDQRVPGSQLRQR